MRLLRVFAAAVIAGSLACSAHAQQSFRSRSFTVESDLPRAQTQALARHMDIVYAELERRFSAFPDRGGLRPELLLYETRQGYSAGLTERYGFSGQGSAGVFVVSRTGAAIAAWLGDRSMHSVERTLQHEAFHLINQVRLGGRVPLWVNEGLAEYFERGLVVRNRFRLGVIDRLDVGRMRTAASEELFLPLEDIVLVGSEEWNRSVARGDAGTLYLQSWAMVHFLIEADGGRYQKRFVRYLELCADGMDHPRAWERVFGEGERALARFEAAWLEWVRAAEPDPLSVARERLEVWALALRELHERGESVESLEELRERLAELGWSAVMVLNGEERVITAESDEWFALLEGARDAAFTETDDGELPMGVSIRGLRGVRPVLSWERVTERERNADERVGDVRSVIEF